MAREGTAESESGSLMAMPTETRVDEKVGTLVHLPPPADEADPADGRLSDVDEWGRSERMRSLVRKAYDPMYRHWFRAEWEGLEHIPADGGALLVANHAGAIPSDAPVIMHGIETELERPCTASPTTGSRACRWSAPCGPASAAWWPTPTTPTGCCVSNASSCSCSRRARRAPARSSPTAISSAASAGVDFVEIAMRAGVPIVPIAVMGSEEAMPTLFRINPLAKLLGVPYVPVTANMVALGPLGAAVPLPAKFKLRVLPPVQLDEEPGRDRYSRSRIMSASEDIRGRIQDALYDLIRNRGSVWKG